MSRDADPADFAEINKNAQKEIFNKVCEMMDKVPAYKPATVSGKPVTAIAFCATFWNNFQVKGHKLVDPPQFK